MNYSDDLSKKGIQKQKIACFVLLIGLYSMGTISSVLESWVVTFFIILIAVTLMRLADSGKFLNIKINALLFWAIPLCVCLIESMRILYWQDVIMYILSFLIMIYVSDFYQSTIDFFFKVIIIFSFLFAIGEYWQLLYIDVYFERIYPIFPEFYQQSIKRQVYFHQMLTGFTTQTSISMEYILLGIVAIIYTMRSKKMKSRMISFVSLLFLGGGLLLTGKRSVVLFLIVALAYTGIITSPLNQRFTKILKITIILAVTLISVYAFILPELSDSRNSIVRIMESFNDDAGADNGRFELFDSAFEGLEDAALIGNGWGWFKSNYETTGAHNIYLQLLCECGVLGAAPIIFVLVGWYVRTRLIISEILNNKNIINPYLKFVYFTQVYILLYGMVGNPIYDYNFLLWYIIAIGMSFNKNVVTN